MVGDRLQIDDGYIFDRWLQVDIEMTDRWEVAIRLMYVVSCII